MNREPGGVGSDPGAGSAAEHPSEETEDVTMKKGSPEVWFRRWGVI